MELTNQIILIAGALGLLSIFASVLSARAGMPLLLVFLGIGMLMGEEGIGGVAYEDVQSAHLIGSLALAVILFDGGMRTDVHTFRVGLRPALTLATLGVLFTAGLTGAAAVWIFNFSWLEGLLLGAIIGSTDAAAVFSLLRNRGLELKQRVGATLEIESGSNDPMAVFLTILLVEALVAGETRPDWHWLAQFGMQMGLGAAAGVAGGWLLSRMVNRVELAPGLYPLLVLAGGLSLFGAVSLVGGSGFLAVYLAGLVVGNRPLQSAGGIYHFHDGLAWLAQIGMFLVLGLLANPTELAAQAGPALLVALILIFVARPLSVFACLLPFRMPWREQLFVSWVGLRGAVPIILALFPMLAGLENAGVFFNVAFFVVIVSLVVQGWTVAPVARRLGLDVPSGSSLHRIDLDIPGQPEFELAAYEVDAKSPIAGRSPESVSLPDGCRLAGVVRDGQPLDLRHLRRFATGDYVYLLAFREALPGIDKLFAVSDPDERRERRYFGEFVLDGAARLADLAEVYGIAVSEEHREKSLAQFITEHFRGRQVKGDRVSLGEIELVVREMRDDQVLTVGIKLSH